MKFLFSFFLVFLLTFQHSQSQVIDTSTDKSPQESYDYFSLKQKRQKIGAWICIGSGVGLFIGGMAIGTDGITELDGSKAGTGGGMTIVGIAAAVASIPLFIVSASNGRKARASLKTDTVTLRTQNIEIPKGIHLALTIDF